MDVIVVTCIDLETWKYQTLAIRGKVKQNKVC